MQGHDLEDRKKQPTTTSAFSVSGHRLSLTDYGYKCWLIVMFMATRMHFPWVTKAAFYKVTRWKIRTIRRFLHKDWQGTCVLE